jgi:hypothetical protein
MFQVFVNTSAFLSTSVRVDEATVCMRVTAQQEDKDEAQTSFGIRRLQAFPDQSRRDGWGRCCRLCIRRGGRASQEEEVGAYLLR